MKQISIKLIYDNCAEKEGFQAGWGFSCLVDLGNRKILFDTGADSKAFFSNLQKLGIRVEEITDVVFSHNHSDHTAGLGEILGSLKEGSRLFLPKKFPTKHVPAGIRTEIVSDFAQIDSQAYSLVLKAGFFLYEQALLLRTQKGLVVITGCAHPGIVHILESAQKQFNEPLYLVLGGFHLFRKNKRYVQKIIDKFKGLQVQIVAPCHCSGESAIEQFNEAFAGQFCKVGTGSVLYI
jgi:7,8-dihydropterin-6-yl-methyl-4-(beta-D-ribofuranosyl)aminobenzene 5'-phosphate synthase